jgi:hypothetical protein
MKRLLASLKEIRGRLSWLDLTATAIAAAGLFLELLGINGGPFSFLQFLASISSFA